MKTIIQSDAGECGVATLAMVARRHGLRLGLAELRRRFPLLLQGASVDQMLGAAQQLGFAARPLRLAQGELAGLALPCILQWDRNRYVVLDRVGGAGLTILDPMHGRVRMSLSDASTHFDGVALELSRTARFGPRRVSATVSVRQLTGPIRGLRALCTQTLLLSLPLQVLVLVAPLLLQWVVDEALVSADHELLAVLVLGLGLALLLQVGVGVMRGVVVAHLSARLRLRWTRNVFSHLLTLPLAYFEQRTLGDIVSRFGSVRRLQRSVSRGGMEAAVDGVLALLTLALMLFYSAKLALVSMSAVALYALVRLLVWHPLRDGTRWELVTDAAQQGHVLESLRGMRSLKAAGREASRRAAHDNLLVEAVHSQTRLAYMGIGLSGSAQLLFGIERVVAIWLAATLVLGNTFTVGMLVACLICREQFCTAMRSLVDKTMALRLLRLHGERLADIVLAAPETECPVESGLSSQACIEVRNLGFRYGADQPWVLQDCSFRIAPGESVALVGASGCGKTTLIKLLLGLLRPCSGSIHVGGQELSVLGARSLRAVVGTVMQEDQLFAGSIADNISFFDPEFDMLRVEAAARLAAVHEDILAMPMGYHGLIGDMGSVLSGGQKQQVLLARALYRQPKLLFLDEATSHLDLARERQVNEAVRQLRLTRLIVAHRPDTIAGADRVLVIERGRIVAQRGPAPATEAEGGSGTAIA